MSHWHIGNDELVLYRGDDATGGAAYRFGAPLITPQAKGSLVAWDGERMQALAVGANKKVLRALSTADEGVAWEDAVGDADMTPDADDTYDIGSIGSPLLRWAAVYAAAAEISGTLEIRDATRAGSGTIRVDSGGQMFIDNSDGTHDIYLFNTSTSNALRCLRNGTSWMEFRCPSGFDFLLGAGNGGEVRLQVNSVDRVLVSSTQNTFNGESIYNAQSATTNAVIDALRVDAVCTGGAVAAGFGAQAKFNLETSTDTQKQIAAELASLWTDPTNGTHDSDFYVRVRNTGAASELLRLIGATDGVALSKSGGALGVLGTTPVTKQTVTGSRASNAALASLLTALAAYGLIVDSSS